MKKLLALLLSIVLCVACFAGCGAGGEKEKKKPKADKGDTVIKVWSTETAAQAFYEELVDDWNDTVGREKKIFIDWKTTTDSNEIDIAQQNKQLPHLFSASGNQRTKFIKSGDVIAIDDLPGGAEFLTEFNQVPTEGDNLIDGKTYFVYPTVRTAGLVYNEDLFIEAGIVKEDGTAKPPTTLSEVREAAKKISKLGDGIYGFAFPLKLSIGYTVSNPLSSYYDGFTPETSQSYVDLDKLTVEYSNYKEQYQWLLDMEKDGSLLTGSITLDNDTARAYFSEGVVGMIPAISWDVGVYVDQYPAKCNWNVCQYPAPDGRELVKNWNQRGGSMMIGKDAAKKNPEATMEVFNFLYSLETRTKVFEAGINLSMKTDVLENYDKSKVDPRFAKFAEFVDETNRYAKKESYTLEGDNWQILFQKVWMGEMSFDAAVKDLETRATRDLRKAVKEQEFDVERQKRVERYLRGEEGLDLTMTH